MALRYTTPHISREIYPSPCLTWEMGGGISHVRHGGWYISEALYHLCLHRNATSITTKLTIYFGKAVNWCCVFWNAICWRKTLWKAFILLKIIVRDDWHIFFLVTPIGDPNFFFGDPKGLIGDPQNPVIGDPRWWWVTPQKLKKSNFD